MNNVIEDMDSTNMIEDSILLIEDNDHDRLEVVKQVAEELGVQYYPASDDFVEALLSVDRWLYFILEKRPIIVLDLRIGKTGGISKNLLEEDIMEIVRKIQLHPGVKKLNCSEIFDTIISNDKIDFFHLIYLMILVIADKRQLRCFAITGGMFLDVKKIIGIDPGFPIIDFTFDNLINYIRNHNFIDYTLQDFWNDTKKINFHEEPEPFTFLKK